MKSAAFIMVIVSNHPDKFLYASKYNNTLKMSGTYPTQ